MEELRGMKTRLTLAICATMKRRHEKVKSFRKRPTEKLVTISPKLKSGAIVVLTAHRRGRAWGTLLWTKWLN